MELVLWLGPELGGSSGVGSPGWGLCAPSQVGLQGAGEDTGWDLHPWHLGSVPGVGARVRSWVSVALPLQGALGVVPGEV